MLALFEIPPNLLQTEDRNFLVTLPVLAVIDMQLRTGVV